MWPPWRKSSPKVHNTCPNFRCSSFKDIQNLCTDDSAGSPKSPNLPHSALAKRSSVFHRVRTVNSILRQWPTRSDSPSSPKTLPSPLRTHSAPQPQTSIQSPPPPIAIPASHARVVVYLTSLRVVRPTFEACRAVLSILSCFRVTVDERDVSMDWRFMEELQNILASDERLTLPRIFIAGRYVGGAEELKHLHEIGELKNLVDELPEAEPGACQVCGGYRFILCDECSGSHKIYSEKVGFRSCTACNVNGLIRCPSCFF